MNNLLKEFERVDAIVQAADLTPFTQPGTGGVLLAESATVQLCSLYHVARPVLSFMATFPFLPATWRTVFVALVGLLDQICPSTGGG